MSASDCQILANQMATKIGPAPDNEYSVPQGAVTQLLTSANILAQHNADVEEKKAAYRQAVQDRDAAHESCTFNIAFVARIVYSRPSNTPGMVSALGLVPHLQTRTKVVPVTPKEVIVVQEEDGAVRLKWDRNGNAPGVNFIVEAQDGAGIWTFQGDTTASKILLTGYTLGVTRYFRVMASKNGTLSLPSTIAVLYPQATAPALRLAA